LATIILGTAETGGFKITRMTIDLSREQSVKDAATAAVPAALADLGALVRIPSIAFPGFDPADVRRSAEAVAALAEGLGIFDTVQIRDAAIPGTDERGMPAVLASRAARNGRPTILLYAHHDVQPVGDEALWDSPPFEPTVRDGRLYGRGAADDKAGVMAHIGALRAFTEAVGPDFDLGVALFIEGEEEAGSRSFAQFLSDNADALRADVIVVADSGNWDARTPALTVSLRGNARFTMRVRTLAHASHSGMFGGAVPDAMMATVTLLSTLWDADGGVAVEGLLEREAATPEYTEATLRDEAGLPDGVRPIGDGTILSRIWNKPSITVTGIDAPSVVNASNTLTPEVAVVISARVAPGQEASEAFAAVEAHLRAHAPFGAELSFTDVDFGDGFLVDTSGWAVATAREALHEGYGVEPVDLGVGGSIPFIADLVREFPAAQILVTGVEDPHARAHSPNESLHLDTFRHALVSEALLLSKLDSRAV
jgi:acetylornithine deacetylase/succinyl-diaminopimelate desuccinylase-like protein